MSDPDPRPTAGPPPPRSARRLPSRVACPSHRPIAAWPRPPARREGRPGPRDRRARGRRAVRRRSAASARSPAASGRRSAGSSRTSRRPRRPTPKRRWRSSDAPVARAARRAVHQPGQGRPRRHRARPRSSADATTRSGSTSRSRTSRRRRSRTSRSRPTAPKTVIPMRADEGHQRLHGHHRRTGRRVGSVAGRPLRARPVEAEDHHHLAQGQARRSTARRVDDQGQDPGPLDAHRPQRRQRCVDHRHGRARTGRSRSSIALKTGTNHITISGTDPAGNASETGHDRPARHGQADGLGLGRPTTGSRASRCRRASGSSCSVDRPGRQARSPVRT